MKEIAGLLGEVVKAFMGLNERLDTLSGDLRDIQCELEDMANKTAMMQKNQADMAEHLGKIRGNTWVIANPDKRSKNAEEFK